MRAVRRVMSGQHWLNRPLARVLDAWCALTGHDFAQHFTELGAASPSAHEPVWCSKCGRTRDATSSTIDRVARALHTESQAINGLDMPWDDLGELQRDSWRSMARAALAAAGTLRDEA